MNETRGVHLRDVADDDIAIFFEYQHDPEANRMAAFPARDPDAHLAHWRRILGDPSVLNRTILIDGNVAGSIASFEQAGRREVGYWIGRDYWGQGVATRALSAFLDLDRTRPLYAHVVTHNTGSIRVLEKNGFTRRETTTGDDGLEEILFVLSQ